MAGTQEEAEASESRNRTINANSDHLDKDWLAAAAQAKGPPEGLDVAGTEWEPKDCAEITDGEGFIELPDGTYHSIGVGVVKVTVEELQRQLQAKGKPALSDAKIAELREDGFVE